MNVANRQLIEDAVMLIEDNLKTDLSLDSIADRLSISKFHFHRIFKSITGTSLMTYVRGRKLTSSLLELSENRLNIIDIACEYNFKYEQSYNRSFKQLFGITPSAYRQNFCELPIVPRLDTSTLSDISSGLLIAPRYCTKSRFYLAGIRTLINHEENMEKATANAEALDFYYKSRYKLANVVHDSVYYGLITYYDFFTADYYMPSVEVSLPFDSDPLFTCQTIERSDYAVFRYVGFHSPQDLNFALLSEVYHTIMSVWLPATSFQPIRKYHFERIDQKNCRDDYCEADIYFPIAHHP